MKRNWNRPVRDTLQTLADVEDYQSETAMPLSHDGRPFESIRDWLVRKMETTRRALPRQMVDRLVVTLEDDPETVAALARLFSKASARPPTVPSAVLHANRRAVKSRTRRRPHK